MLIMITLKSLSTDQNPANHSFIMAGSVTTLIRWDMWMTEGQAIVSPHCYMKQDGFLLRFHQTMALHSLELELGFQV